MNRFRILLSFLLATLTMTSWGQLASAPWPKVHQNNQNTGLATGSGSNGVQRWSFTAAGGITNESPAIGADGTIYFSSDLGVFHALSPNGTEKWTYQTLAEWPPSTPALATDGTIYIGVKDQLVALNQNGSQKWSCGLVASKVGVGRPASSDRMVIFIWR